MSSPMERRAANHNLRRRDSSAYAAARPDPSRPEGDESLEQIRHIVLLMLENHSFDNHLGLLGGEADGLTLDASGRPTASNPASDGTPIRIRELTLPIQKPRVPSQSWHASHIQWNGGANDGFVRSIEETVPGGDREAGMGYWGEQAHPFYYGLARTFSLADRWHCSCLGPTFPNRRFLMAGTANGLIDDLPFGMQDYPKGGTIFDLLDRNGIEWANYHHTSTLKAVGKRLLGRRGLMTIRGLRTLLSGAFPTLGKAAQKNLQFTADLYPAGLLRCLHHLRDIAQFATDVAAGTLPAVSIVDPGFQSCSEENPQDIRQGEAFAAWVITTLMGSRVWPHTLLVWFYDEHGGYFDHVPPPAAPEPDDVPGGTAFWTIAAWCRGCWKCSTSGTVSSMRKWNLPPLTRRDAAADDVLEMVDLEAPPAFLTPPDLPAPLVRWAP